MKKILYVEDDLFGNISTIKLLFKDFLTEDLIEKLDYLDSQSNDFTPENKEIKSILDDCSLLEVEFSFLSALNKIQNTPENYFLFIVDRNLSEKVDNEIYKKELDEIKSKNIGYKIDYENKDGDFLFLILFLNTNINLFDSFYFLTANDRSEFIFNQTITDISLSKNNFNLELFKTKNKIPKNNDNKNKLAKYISDYSKNYEYIIKNERYIKIFKNNNINNTIFLEILKEHQEIDLNNFNKQQNKQYFNDLLLIDENGILEDINNINKTKIGYNLLLTRKLFESILKSLASHSKINNYQPNWWQNNPPYFDNNNNFTVKNFMRFLAELNKTAGKHDIFNYNNKLDVTSIIAFNLYSIWEITSAFGAHNNTIKGYEPTLDTINSLIYQLKDIIIWFGEVMKKI